MYDVLLSDGVPQGPASIHRRHEELLPYELIKEVDHYTTNKSLGTMAMGIILAVVLIVILSDVITIYNHIKMFYYNVKSCCHKYGGHTDKNRKEVKTVHPRRCSVQPSEERRQKPVYYP